MKDAMDGVGWDEGSSRNQGAWLQEEESSLVALIGTRSGPGI